MEYSIYFCLYNTEVCIHTVDQAIKFVGSVTQNYTLYKLY